MSPREPVHVEWPQLLVVILILIVAQVFVSGGLVYWHSARPHEGAVSVTDWKRLELQIEKYSKATNVLVQELEKSSTASVALQDVVKGWKELQSQQIGDLQRRVSTLEQR